MDDVAVMTAIAFTLSSYVLTSLVLFKYPGLLYGQRKPKFRCRHISHRGGAGENLENTIAAFDHAVSMGTDMLEIDLQLTKDGVVVVSHDDNLVRTAGLDTYISRLNYDELPLLNRRIRVDFDADGYCEAAPDLRPEDRRIPRLSELFERYPRTLPVNIDIKSNNDTLIRKVSELISEHGREDYIAWGNFSEVVRRKCYKENPRVSTYFSSRGVIKLFLLTYSGLLPFVPLRDSFLEMFLPSVFLKKYDFHTDDASKRRVQRFTLWMIDKLLIRKFLFEHLKKRGIQTYLWVLNDEEEFDQAFRIGATGVMTDYPTKLKSYLDANPQLKRYTE